MKKLNLVINKINNFLQGVCCFLLCACTLSAIINVIMRYVFNRPVHWSEEFSALTFCWLVYILQPKLEHENNQLAMTFIFNKGGRIYQKTIRVLECLIIISVLSYLLKYALEVVMVNYRTGIFTPAMDIPWWIPTMILPISFVSMIIVNLLKLITFDFKVPADAKKKEEQSICS